MSIPEIPMVKTMKISEETHARLASHGRIGETFEDVIKKLLDHYEKDKKNEQ